MAIKGSDKKSADVAVVMWSQTGTGRAVANRLVAGNDRARVFDLPGPAYPFPWGLFHFFGVLPESLLGQRQEWPNLDLSNNQWNLVILVWPVWFLAVPPAVRAWLQGSAMRLQPGTPLISVITCRNVWQAASLEMRNLARRAGFGVVGEIVLCDPTPRLLSLVTVPLRLVWGRTVRWNGLTASTALDSPEMNRIDALHLWLANREPDQSVPSDELLAQLRPMLDKANLLPEIAVKATFRAFARFMRWISDENSITRHFLTVLLFLYIALIAPPAHLFGRILYILTKVFWATRLERVEFRLQKYDNWSSSRSPNKYV